MIFPFDVNKTVADSGKVAGENKVQAVIVCFVLGSVFAFLGLSYLLGTLLGFGLGVTVAAYLAILLFVGVLLFRFVIFDEDVKKRELESAEGDSFGKYMWLRANMHTNTLVGEEKVTVYEYVNGSSMCIMELRFGSNDDEKAKRTRNLNEQMLQIATINGLESRIIDAPENFRNSKEFREHVVSINGIKDRDAARNVMLIDDAIMEESCRLCNVDVIYFMLRTTGNYQRADLEFALKKIFYLMKENVSAYRSVHFLEPNELMEFYREFYGIAAIDLSMMRTIELAQQVTDEFNGVVTVLRMQAQSGRIYESTEQLVVGNNDVKNLSEVR